MLLYFLCIKNDLTFCNYFSSGQSWTCPINFILICQVVFKIKIGQIKEVWFREIRVWELKYMNHAIKMKFFHILHKICIRLMKKNIFVIFDLSTLFIQYILLMINHKKLFDSKWKSFYFFNVVLFYYIFEYKLYSTILSNTIPLFSITILHFKHSSVSKLLICTTTIKHAS